MKKRSAFFVMLLLVGAALTGGASQALAGTNCWANYQACLSNCPSGNTSCSRWCFELYNVCRFY